MATPGTKTYMNNEPVTVIFNGVALGFNEPGDITVTVTQTWVDKMAHQTGTFVLDKFFNGATIQVAANFSEILNWDLWTVAFPMGQEQIDAATPPNDRFAGTPLAATVTYWVGRKASTYAHKLILRPIQEYTAAATEETRDIVIPLAFCENVDAIPFSVETPNSLSLTFSGLFDTTATDGSNLWFRGLETETGAWVAA